jgi:hypothetical protein
MDYLDNHSCKECHEKIYEEYQSSMHAKGYFTDELHRKIADKVSDKRYGCATCHMPMADNLDKLLSGDARPDKSNKTHTDAVSCYFCHTIAYVKKAHRFNINTKARQAAGYKPTFYGRLHNPDDSDKHSSVKNPIYAKNACLGCHSHKLNDNNVTIFRAMTKGQDSVKCIECHMPEVEGGVEKMDKRTRGRHASHHFAGIRDAAMRAKSVDLNATHEGEILKIRIKNKMGHPLIIQPARVKYLRIHVSRDGKVLWSNYHTHPSEDAQGYFAYSFLHKGAKVLIPATATAHERVNNLQADEERILEYKVPGLRKGDRVTIALFVKLAKDDCMRAVDLEDHSYNEPMPMKEVEVVLEE